MKSAKIVGAAIVACWTGAAAAATGVRCHTELGSRVELSFGETIEFKIARDDAGMFGPTRVLFKMGVLAEEFIGLSDLRFQVDAATCTRGTDPAVIACSPAGATSISLTGESDTGPYFGTVTVQPAFAIRRVLVPEETTEHYELDWSFAAGEQVEALNRVTLASCLASQLL